VFLLSSASAVMAFIARRHLPESPLWKAQKETMLSPAAAFAFIWRQGLLAPMLKGFVLGVLKLGTYWTCYIWLPKFLQNQLHQSIGSSALWIVTAQCGQFLGMMVFGFYSDRYGRRLAYTVYSVLTAAALYVLAFHWQQVLPHGGVFWTVMFLMGIGSGCTAGFGALLAELFPTPVRNFAMGTAYNTARGVQFFAPLLVSAFVASYGIRGGLSVPMFLALGTATWVWSLPETRGRNLGEI